MTSKRDPRIDAGCLHEKVVLVDENGQDLVRLSPMAARKLAKLMLDISDYLLTKPTPKRDDDEY